MSEMIELVARAMCAPFPEDEQIWLGAYMKRWESHRESARVAIEAVRKGITPEIATKILDASSFLDWEREPSRSEEWFGNYQDFKLGWDEAFSQILGGENQVPTDRKGGR